MLCKYSFMQMMILFLQKHETHFYKVRVEVRFRSWKTQFLLWLINFPFISEQLKKKENSQPSFSYK